MKTIALADPQLTGSRLENTIRSTYSQRKSHEIAKQGPAAGAPAEPPNPHALVVGCGFGDGGGGGGGGQRRDDGMVSRGDGMPRQQQQQHWSRGGGMPRQQQQQQDWSRGGGIPHQHQRISHAFPMPRSSSSKTGLAAVACRGSNSSSKTGLTAAECRGSSSSSSNGLAAVVILISINVGPMPPARQA